MRPLLPACLSLFFLLLITAGDIRGQRLAIKVYDNEARLSTGGTRCFQDSKGWIWVVNGYELMRYDGHRFITVQPASGVLVRNCYNIVEMNGAIWVLSSSGLLKVSGDSLRVVNNGNEYLEIRSFLHYKGKNYFLSRKGLFHYEKDNLEPVVIFKNLELLQDGNMVSFRDSLLLSYETGKYILVFNLRSKTMDTIAVSVNEIKQEVNGDIYLLVGGEGILLLKDLLFVNSKASIKTELIIPLSGSAYNHFSLNGRNDIWVSRHSESLTHYTGEGKKQVYTMKDGLPGLSVGQLFLDREKNTWVGMRGSFCKIPPKDWQKFTVEDSLYSNEINFISGDATGRRAFAFSPAGVNILSESGIGQLRKTGGQPFFCNRLQVVGTGPDFIYSIGSELFQATMNLTNYRVNAVQKLAGLPGNIMEMTADKNGNLFLLTRSGIYLYRNRLVQRLITVKGEDQVIRKIFIDRNQRLWVGNFNTGLACYQLEYKDTEPAHLAKIISLDTVRSGIFTMESIRAIGEYKDYIIVGTRYNGAFILKIKGAHLASVQHFEGKEGMSASSIWGLATAPDRSCWVATASGLLRLQLSGNKWIVKEEGNSRGIFATSHIALTGNTIWTSSNSGLFAINFGNKKSAYSFRVAMTGLLVNGEPMSFHENDILKLSSYQNNLQFNFSANTYVNEEAVQYSYNLRGAEGKEWSIPARDHTLNFSSLQSGNYILQVKASNVSGTESSNIASFRFKIMQPFWMQGWFIAMAVLLLAGGLFFLYRVREKRLMELALMRNRISRDLHDEIGSTLTSIQILSRVSQKHVGPGSRAGELLEKVIDQSEQVQQNMSDIVWAIHPDNDQVKNLAVRMREYLSHTVEEQQIRINFEMEEQLEQENLSMQQRKDVFLFFKEAINNVVKHSGCNQVSVKFCKKNRLMELTIADDGRGFIMGQQKEGNGIINMHQRAKALGGSLKINTATGEGTSIRLFFNPTS